MVVEKKICVLGAPGVGKTSLVRRFVLNVFQDESLVPVAIGIEKRRVAVGDQEILLVLWDFAGDQALEHREVGYLRSAAGYLLVADVAQPDSVAAAVKIQARIAATLGPAIPFILVLNKADHSEAGGAGVLELDLLMAAGWSIFRTCAKSGEGVESAFQYLATLCAARPSP